MRHATNYLFIVAVVAAMVAAAFGLWLIAIGASALVVAAAGLAYAQLRADGRLDREIQAINKE